eukprot:TRINITY_DN2196_c0_g1_i1.p1 TRINITY_DN2196_c0_g1~~TRINITY_DN2196_c0_g1_i1.p1  ORF type:complete len:627 (+),score=114.88 TRINITY_DN2196_c0_g1_i1:59-1882(+)
MVVGQPSTLLALLLVLICCASHVNCTEEGAQVSVVSRDADTLDSGDGDGQSDKTSSPDLVQYQRSTGEFTEPSPSDNDTCTDMVFSFQSTLMKGCNTSKPVTFKAADGISLTFKVGVDYTQPSKMCVLMDVDGIEGRNDSWALLKPEKNKLTLMEYEMGNLTLKVVNKDTLATRKHICLIIPALDKSTGTMQQSINDVLVNPLACLCEMVQKVNSDNRISTSIVPPLYDRTEIGKSLARIVSRLGGGSLRDPDVTKECMYAANIKQVGFQWSTSGWMHSGHSTIADAKFRFVSDNPAECQMWMRALVSREDLLADNPNIRMVPGTLATPLLQETGQSDDKPWLVYLIAGLMLFLVVVITIFAYRERKWIRDTLCGGPVANRAATDCDTKGRRSKGPAADIEVVSIDHTELQPTVDSRHQPTVDSGAPAHPIERFSAEVAAPPPRRQNVPYPHSSAASLTWVAQDRAEEVDEDSSMKAPAARSLRERASQGGTMSPSGVIILPSPGLAALPRRQGQPEFVPGPGWESTMDGTELSEAFTPGMPLAARSSGTLRTPHQDPRLSNSGLAGASPRFPAYEDHDPPVSRLYRNSAGVLVEYTGGDDESEYSQ